MLSVRNIGIILSVLFVILTGVFLPKNGPTAPFFSLIVLVFVVLPCLFPFIFIIRLKELWGEKCKHILIGLYVSMIVIWAIIMSLQVDHEWRSVPIVISFAIIFGNLTSMVFQLFSLLFLYVRKCRNS